MTLPVINRRDVTVLENAGISDIGALVAIAAEFVRRCPVREPSESTVPLSASEQESLRSLGARGLDADDDTVARAERSNLMTLTAEYAQLVASADSATQVAERLGVKASRVRQRVGDRSLYSIETAGGRVFPRFQFAGPRTLPGLERVLRAFDPDAHPVAVARFFLSRTSDLESEVVDGEVSPRDWLLAGLPVEPVVELAAAP